MPFWLLKTEPADFSISDLESKGIAVWDGVRNYAARNALRDGLQIDDRVLIYHSSCKTPGISGTGRVVTAGYPDPAQFDSESAYFDPKASLDNPRWFCVDIAFEAAFQEVVTLAKIKKSQALADMVLLKQPRLSVQSVTAEEFEVILQIAG